MKRVTCGCIATNRRSLLFSIGIDLGIYGVGSKIWGWSGISFIGTYLSPLLLIHTVYFLFLRVFSGLGRLGGCCLDWQVWEFLVKHIFCSYSMSVSHTHFQFHLSCLVTSYLLAVYIQRHISFLRFLVVLTFMIPLFVFFFFVFYPFLMEHIYRIVYIDI